ncbi:MAG: protein kinase [Polyangiaceae bacterium]
MNHSARSVLKPGDMVADKYRVERVLGAGAMGVVVAAMHVDLRERRALKVMNPEMVADADAVERFLREARAVSVLRTPFVARVFDTGRLASGVPYTVMEYLEGKDLKAVLAERERLPLEEACHYFLQICQAVGDAHALGIVHRDLKPANVMLTRGADGAPMVKVLDFGIAKFLKQGDVELTGTMAMLGSPLYMSPEQMRSSSTVDARTDVWALGAILYRMLGGRVPFPGESTPEICAAVIAETPTPLSTLAPNVPRRVEAVVMRCLEKPADARFRTVGELANALASALAEPAIGASGAAPSSQPGSASSARGSLPSESALHRGSSSALPEASGVGAASALDATSKTASWSSTARAEKRRGSGAIVAGVSLALVLGAGAAAFALTRPAEPANARKAADPVQRDTVGSEVTAAPTASAAPPEPRPPDVVALSGPSASVDTSPSAAPRAPSATAPPPNPAVPPPYFVPPRTPAGAGTDAFGRDRK